MYDIIRKKIFYKKLFINIRLEKKNLKILRKITDFFLKKHNYLINIYVLKNKKEFNNYNKGFKNYCDGTSLVYNYYLHNISLKIYTSDIIILKYKNKNMINCFLHAMWHVKNNEHKNKVQYKKMILTFFLVNKIINV